MNLTELFKQSRLNNRAEYVEKEKAKLGVLRAGSSGIITDKGEVAGNCLRKSHLRSLGIELDPPTEDKLIMFDLGYASEDIVYEKLISALPEGHVVLREEEIPIEWLTTNGTKVTGRPDIVICKTEKLLSTDDRRLLRQETDSVSKQEVLVEVASLEVNKAVLGLELKSVHSVWVAREVLFNRKPKLGNLVQSAHYMWKLNVPYKLTYTSYSQLGQGMVGNDWMAKMFPRPGEPGSEFIEFNKKNQIKHIRQFEIVYDLKFDDDGILCYKLEAESSSKWTKTIISRDGIESYFEFVSHMEGDKTLGPRPAQLDTLGGKAGYKDCDYCPLKPTCDSHEKLGYDKWLEEVKKQEALKSNVK